MLKYTHPFLNFLISNIMNNLLYLSLLAGAAASAYYYGSGEESLNRSRHSLITSFCLAAAFTYHYLVRRTRYVFLVDFACFKPGLSCLCTTEMILERAKHVGFLSEESLKLVAKILDRSGLGPKTYLPEGVLHIPPKLTFDEARKETDTVLFGAVDELLEKTGVQSKDIGILVVNCCLFNPTPSLSDTIVNHYKLRGNILTYDLSGMGCSAGVLAVDFAKQLLQVLKTPVSLDMLAAYLMDWENPLIMVHSYYQSLTWTYQVHPNSYALVLSTENETSSIYRGNNPSMMLTNCLFRMGGSAALLSSHPSDRCRSKYQLIHTLRTHVGADDNSYKCVFQEEDEAHKIGVSLSKELMNVARDALKIHITSLGPVVLPISEKVKFVVNFVKRKFLKIMIEAYVPNFTLAFDHFCIHTGGRAVLDRMQKSLELDDWHMEPSRMTLYRFGNTSSSSVWYELAYCEAKGRVKKGDRVWQMAFGSGFKVNTAVWVALKNIEPPLKNTPWRDEIDDFPVKLNPPKPTSNNK